MKRKRIQNAQVCLSWAPSFMRSQWPASKENGQGEQGSVRVLAYNKIRTHPWGMRREQGCRSPTTVNFGSSAGSLPKVDPGGIKRTIFWAEGSISVLLLPSS